jgi:hypothetical protein
MQVLLEAHGEEFFLSAKQTQNYGAAPSLRKGVFLDLLEAEAGS